MLSKSKAWLVAALVALFNFSYPVLVTLKLSRAEDSERWIKNDPTFNVFMTLIFFFVVGVFLASADFRPLRNLGRYRPASYLILVLLLILTMFSVASTFDRPLLEPFLFKDSQESLAMETQIRATIKQNYRSLSKIHNEDQRIAAKATLDQERSDAIRSYEAKFPALLTISDLRSRGSYCAWLALLINAEAGLAAAVIFWYLWNIVLFRRIFRDDNAEWIVLVVGLLAFWFPLRLYAEWYIGFYSFETMKNYYVFLFLALVAVCCYAFCIFKLAKSISVKVFSAVGTGILGLIGLIGKFQPKWLGAAVEVFEELPFGWFIASIVIIVLVLGAMVFSLLGLPLPSTIDNRAVSTRIGRSRRSRSNPNGR